VKFLFNDLFYTPKSEADYLIIGQTFPTVFLEGVPIFTIRDIIIIRRFIIFVDVMYENKVTLVIQAELSLDDMFVNNMTDRLYFDDFFALD